MIVLSIELPDRVSSIQHLQRSQNHQPIHHGLLLGKHFITQLIAMAVVNLISSQLIQIKQVRF